MKTRSARVVSSAIPKTIKSEKRSAPVKKESAPRTKKMKTEAGAPGQPPPTWKDVFDKIKHYRQHHPAVVDTMGCAQLAERDKPLKQQRYQTLVALMLSSQTKDTVTSVVVKRLQTDLPGGLSIASILAIDEHALDIMIHSVGFHTRKAGYIKQTAQILHDQYNDDIPDSIEGLTSLPGVGPKMGYLALQSAWHKNMGIGVDVHVHRISNRLGWRPEDTRLCLQSWLPKEHWNEINPILVGYGQSLCLPRGPKCQECPVNDLCPSSTVKKKRAPKIKQEEPMAQELVVKREDSVTIKNEPVEW
ncbi:DNA glycosylase [Hesseltinella vesiculosa]|uniref:Endonuclease III homolog n=1 Tax=Hesseltinella vesiculosa TaxID=101127 RepID=A0A1X2GJR2_9FUNG|nr:DNA glycosylase [Hesseltinella vesiculosa]